MTDDETKRKRLGEIDAAMGRVLWSIGRVTDDQHEAMRELLASLVRVLDETARARDDGRCADRRDAVQGRRRRRMSATDGTAPDSREGARRGVGLSV